MSQDTEEPEDNSFTNGAAELIPEHVAENYRALVNDETRNLSYKKLAKSAKANGDKALAAWARQQDASHGKDVTPAAATTVEHTVRYEKLLLPALEALVAERSIDATDLKLKADFVAALELADEEARS